jgi:CRISPR system Cascade subunit CasD
MERPTFTPYLGRKSNPSGLPFCPQIMSGDLKGVLGSCSKKFKEKLNSVGLNLPELQTDGYWEGECQDLKPKFIIRRRDVPLSRTKWLFEERTINYGEVLNREDSQCTTPE